MSTRPETFKWDESLSLGVEKIDAQHKHLFDLVDILQEGIEDGYDHERMREIVLDLVRYTEEHFSAEEKLMEEFSYPEYEEHKDEHMHFVREVNKAVNDFAHKRISLSLRLSKFLRMWITDHIQKVDTRLVPFLKAQGF